MGTRGTRGTARMAVVAVLLLLALAGCGESNLSGADAAPTGDSTRHPSTSSPSADPGTESSDEGCPYLTAEQVTEVLGSPTVETAGTANACFFDPAGGNDNDGPAVLLNRIDIQIDPTDYAAQSRDLCQGKVTDVYVGDVAFACMSALGPQGQLYSGRVLITVAVSGMTYDDAGIAAAVELLKQVQIPARS
jgi:hypothetical protein